VVPTVLLPPKGRFSTFAFVWMRPYPEGLDFDDKIAVYVDNLTLLMRDPQAFTDILTEKYTFNLKST
jgi:hypothetical protein